MSRVKEQDGDRAEWQGPSQPPSRRAFPSRAEGGQGDRHCWCGEKEAAVAIWGTGAARQQTWTLVQVGGGAHEEIPHKLNVTCCDRARTSLLRKQ